ncbi:ABC transporter permease [Pseudonocardia alni]|jgi:ABC-2 type transport system permease protein|uniref:Transport permease protein n=1 Tax=Pseudonocardia alni TaxID=33907 RepID=A0A852W463_PSEA5|nr:MULTISPECIES: ABC transporter permease [Pseudonocardia]MCO7197041.1 ABC transporter permease [Pseudonocardia sp. McavD-2-B]MYW75021.1 ABC transporter permease [Pseudonocardia sp. SID8383]NYG03763.1 ABC-2 type transport system permease protein [Pseudonocardia antarctica]
MTGRAFLAVLRRDLFVTGRELPSFLAQTLVQPFFFLLVFVVVLGRGGFVSPEYGQIMLPGLIALNAMFGALQAVTLPLVFELSWTREIDDRLLAPMPVWAVAVEKIAFAGMRGLLASLLMVPIGFAMIDIRWPAEGLAPALLMVVLGSLLGAAMGLTIGTAVPPRRINILFAVIFTPLLFTGSVQYPWLTLADLRWFQVLSAVNPLTYVSEGIRASLVPQVPHIPLWVCVLVPVAAIVLFTLLGIRGFLRRALD